MNWSIASQVSAATGWASPTQSSPAELWSRATGSRTAQSGLADDLDPPAADSPLCRSPAASAIPAESGPAAVSARRTAKLARLEAVLLVADTALAPRKIALFASLADATEARTLMNRLNAIYDQSQSPFRIERVAAGYRLLTRPEYSLWLGKLHHREADLKLTPTALETLTIIAYRQPLTRADIEAIRGVQCAEILKQLMDRGLVRIAGEDDSLGRPFLYETTRQFLELFGLKDVEDLPLADRLRKQPRKESPRATA